jgi:hypothetical protein
LAILQRQLADWDHVQQQIQACDQDLQAMMKRMPDAATAPSEPPAGHDHPSAKAQTQEERQGVPQ